MCLARTSLQLFASLELTVESKVSERFCLFLMFLSLNLLQMSLRSLSFLHLNGNSIFSSVQRISSLTTVLIRRILSLWSRVLVAFVTRGWAENSQDGVYKSLGWPIQTKTLLEQLQTFFGS